MHLHQPKWASSAAAGYADRHYRVLQRLQPDVDAGDMDSEANMVARARYVLLPLANLVTGYSVKAMERKIERGDWQEGKVWLRAPDGRILIDLVGYERWVERA